MKYIIFAFFIIFFNACGTKRQYFEPAYVNGTLNPSKSLKSSIIDWNIYSAKLNNNYIVDYSIDKTFKLEKNYILLNYQENEFLTADNDGNFKIYNDNNEEIYHYKFSRAVIGASINENDIAIILSDNTIIYANRSLGIKFSKTLASAPAQDNRVASPLFIKNAIIYPTLDGRLMIMKKDDFSTIKNIVISAEMFFNNVIFLKKEQDRIIAATQNKILSISDHNAYELKANISNIVSNEKYIFILEKNGNIIKTDLQLDVLKEIKFDFAIFTKASLYKDILYIFEKTGYVVKSDENFDNLKVFKFNQASDKMSFMQDNYFYYSDKILYLDNIK